MRFTLDMFVFGEDVIRYAMMEGTSISHILHAALKIADIMQDLDTTAMSDAKRLTRWIVQCIQILNLRFLFGW